MLPQWVHEIATFATLAGTSVWLVVQLARIGRSDRGSSCARCEHAEPVRVPASARGRRSPRLRVLED